MSMTTLTLAKAQLRVTHTLEDVLIQQLLDQAEKSCIEYLDRNVYPDSASLTAAQSSMLADMQTASDAYDAAKSAADAMGAGVMKDLAYETATRNLNEAKAEYRRIVRGMVVNERFTGATLLLVSHWYANRASVVVGSSANEVPMSVCYLLDPDRAQLGV